MILYNNSFTAEATAVAGEETVGQRKLAVALIGDDYYSVSSGAHCCDAAASRFARSGRVSRGFTVRAVRWSQKRG